MKTLSLLLLGAVFAVAQTCQTTDIPSNGSFDGALIESDCTVRDFISSQTSNNFKADALRIKLTERLVLRVRMTSAEIDSYAYVVNDRGVILARNDNSGGGKNSEVSIQLSAGTYTIVAATSVAGLGTYQVTTSTRLPKVCNPQEISLTGEAVEADLMETDCAGVDLAVNATDTAVVDLYKIDVPRASVLDITMTSTTVTPSLSLWDARAVRRGNIAATTNSARLRISVPAGIYTLRAGTSRATLGAYRLTAKREDRRVCTPAELVPGETLAGQLAASDCRIVDVLMYETWVGPVDQYTLELKERSVVKLRMESALLDSGLIIVHPELGPIAENDDAAANTVDSEIYMSLPAGKYEVWALDYYGDSGRYTIKLDVEKPRSCSPVSFTAPGTATGSLTTDGCRTMDLATSQSTAPAAVLTMKVTERAWTTVSATGTGLTPLVRLLQSDGMPIGIEGPVAEKAVLLLPGTYTVQLTTRGGGTGDVTVTSTTRPPAACEATPLPLNELTSGELTRSDCVEQEILPFLNTSARADLWKIEITEAGSYRAEVGAADAMPYLFVFDADMNIVAFDINLTVSAGARTVWKASPGTYYVLAGAYTGPTPYTVRVGPDETAPTQ